MTAVNYFCKARSEKIKTVTRFYFISMNALKEHFVTKEPPSKWFHVKYCCSAFGAQV